MPSKFATEDENVFQLLGDPRPPTGAPPGIVTGAAATKPPPPVI